MRDKPVDCPNIGVKLRDIKSKLCSCKDKTLPVYACQRFGECTVDPAVSDGSIPYCKKCNLGPWAFEDKQ